MKTEKERSGERSCKDALKRDRNINKQAQVEMFTSSETCDCLPARSNVKKMLRKIDDWKQSR